MTDMSKTAAYPTFKFDTRNVKAWWRDSHHGSDFTELMERTLSTLEHQGPTRILNDNGVGVGKNRASDVDISIFTAAPVIFIRNDGWTLGVHRGNHKEAHDTWKNEWVAYMIPGKLTVDVRDIADYPQGL